MVFISIMIFIMNILMVKYGKEFRKNQKADWKDKYFDYKAKKQKI